MIFTNHNGYSSSHPWYYKTGGDILTPRMISMMAHVGAKKEFETLDSDRHIFSGEVDAVIKTVNSQPQSKRMKIASDHHHHELFKIHLPRYRTMAHRLRRFRITGDDPSTAFSDVHTSIALKHNHLYWHMRNLWILHFLKDSNPQGDLFNF